MKLVTHSINILIIKVQSIQNIVELARNIGINRIIDLNDFIDYQSKHVKQGELLL